MRITLACLHSLHHFERQISSCKSIMKLYVNYCKLIIGTIIMNALGCIIYVGRLGGIRQTPGYLQKQPCHLPEKTSVQLLCAASYDIWCRDLDTDQNKHRTNLRPHRPKWKEVCSTSHTKIEGPTSGLGREQNS